MSFQDTLKSFHKQQTKILRRSRAQTECLQSENITPRTSNFVEQIENMKNKKENSNLTDILHEEEQTEKEISNVVDRLKLMLTASNEPIKQGIVAKISDKPITPRKPRKPKI